jgi:polyhydroxyalkanoate synthase
MTEKLKLIPSDATKPTLTAQASKSKQTVPKPENAPSKHAYETLDRMAHASLAKATSGLAPSVLGEAWMDWAVHLATSPGKQMLPL